MSKTKTVYSISSIPLYRDIMDLIKVRQDSSRYFDEWLIATKYQNIPGGMGFEFLYLQLRMICESIALACIVAHSDIKETKSKNLFNNWSADEIITRLDRLHKDFYPHPVRQVLNSDGQVTGVASIKSGYLTKARFLELYTECNRNLHLGSLKRNLKPMSPDINSVDPIRRWHNEITELLNTHWIPLIDGKGQLWTLFSTPPHGAARVDLYLNGPPAPFVDN